MNSRTLPTIALVLGLITAPASARAAGPALSLPDTGPGRVAAAYFTAFNSGRDEALRAFFTANVSKSGLAERPVEQRVSIHRQMRDEHGRFALGLGQDTSTNCCSNRLQCNPVFQFKTGGRVPCDQLA